MGLQDGCKSASSTAVGGHVQEQSWKLPDAGAQVVSAWKQPVAGEVQQDMIDPTQPPLKKMKKVGQVHWKQCPQHGVHCQLSSVQSWKTPSVSLVAQPATSKAGKTVRHHVSLDVPMLSLVGSTDNDDRPATEYTRKALDPDRVARVLVGSCSCKSNCFGLFKPSQVLEICPMWHSMSDESQHHFLNAQWECSLEGLDAP